MQPRPYDPARDAEAITRIFFEVGWLDRGEDTKFHHYTDDTRAMVADLDGSAECFVNAARGSIRHLQEDLCLSCIIGLATSRIARKQGLAGRLLAHMLGAEAVEGALVAILGMFDQGYYDRLGFGSGAYDHQVTFDPSTLRATVEPRVPQRLTKDDWELIHACRLARRRGHGAVSLEPAASTRGDMAFSQNGFGLGYRDGPDGELTHHIWCYTNSPEQGPYRVRWLCYQSREQFLELMALLRNLGDQVRLVRMTEPPGVQLQDVLDRPFHHRDASRGGRFEARCDAAATWQARILDLPECLARTRLPWGETRLNLALTDPIEACVDADRCWRGIGGDYVVTLGPESEATPGRDPSLPTLAASVGAFTRLWLGVRPATSLAITDDLSGPPELLEQLDRLLGLPDPKPDWDF